MAANKRSPIQRERDLVIIADLYLRDKTQQEIADHISATSEYKIARTQVAYDLEDIRGRWLAACLRDFDQARAEQLARIDKLEAMYFQAWDNSQAEKKITTTERIEGKETVNKIKLQKQQEFGDLACLDGIAKCIEMRSKLLGLNAPERMQVDSRSINMNATDSRYSSLSDHELERELERKMRHSAALAAVMPQARVIDITPAPQLMSPDPADA